jgi:hypothetical protein
MSIGGRGVGTATARAVRERSAASDVTPAPTSHRAGGAALAAKRALEEDAEAQLTTTRRTLQLRRGVACRREPAATSPVLRA